MHAMNMWLTDAATVVVGADWALHPWCQNNVGGVTAGQTRHNSSNVGGVTAGQAGHNSSNYNRTPVERPSSSTTIPLIRPHFV